MKKFILLALCLCLALPVLASCGVGGGEDVSVFYYTYSDTFISGVRNTTDRILTSEGLAYHNYDANSIQATQTEQIDTAISKGTSVLAVNVVDTGSDDAAKTIIQKAKNASLPVIFFNRSVSEEVLNGYDKCVFIGTDYEMAGRLQGEMIGKYLIENYSTADINGDGVISYVMFKGQQGNSEAEARTTLAVEEANKLLTAAGKPKLTFYDKNNPNKYLVDQDGNWSNSAANNYMKTILSGYSESGGNMVELIIANNDEMALGALGALEEAGYNKTGKRTIPVFGVDATDAAKSKIASGAMTGTVKQDAEGMANAIAKVASNMLNGRAAFEGINETDIVSDKRINIPYSVYTGEE